MKTPEVKALLRNRFRAPTHAIFFEVSDATGFNGTGWADAISMNLWPSHGLELEGYEIKVSRSDWKRELAKPSKAEKFAQRCDRWWIVTTEGVIDDESEIPRQWGWIMASPNQLKIQRKAARNEPIPIDRHFLAALLRGAGKADQVEIEAICQKRLNELREHDERQIAYEVDRRADKATSDTKIMEGLRKAMNADPDAEWMSDGQAIAAILAVYKSGVAGTWEGLDSAAQKLEDAADKIRSAHARLNLPKSERKKRGVA